MSNPPTIPVIVTGVGDTVGQALLKALRLSAIPTRAIGTDRDHCSAGLHWVDRACVLPHCAHAEAYLDAIRKICAEDGVRLIFPGSERELELLARHAGSLYAETGAIVVASAPEVLRIGLNKWETCRFLERAGLNFPRFARLEVAREVEHLVADCGFPLIAKWRRGTGGRGLAKVHSWREIKALRASGVEMVVQEYLRPEDGEYSVEVYTLQDGRQAGSIAYRRQHMVAGDTYKAHIVAHPAVQAEAERVAAALGTAGPCNVQLRLTDRGPVTFEVNPRFSGGVSLRAHFGYNEVDMALRDLALGESVPPPQVRQGVALRFWEEMYLEDEEAAAHGGPQQANIEVTGGRGEAMRVLGTDESDEWTALVRQCVQHDFHHLPHYHRVSEQLGEGVARLFAYREGEHRVALPLLLRPVDPMTPDGWQDATSVYGYGGPISSEAEIPDRVTRHFQGALEAALRERKVVTAFTRMHPLIPQQRLLEGIGDLRAKGQTVSLDLALSEDAIWAGYSKTCRASLRKLGQMGFVGRHDAKKEHLGEFIRVYHETMRRAGARSSYFFDAAYFEAFVRELGPAAQLFVVLLDGAVVAASLATLCDGIAQDHLGGTSTPFLKFSPDRLIVETERKWAQAMGARVLHLGGGVGAREDSVFRYKAAFSGRRHTFSTWQWVLQPEAYEELCARQARWNAANGLRPGAEGFFPEYRCPTVPVETSSASAGEEVVAYV